MRVHAARPDFRQNVVYVTNVVLVVVETDVVSFLVVKICFGAADIVIALILLVYFNSCNFCYIGNYRITE